MLEALKRMFKNGKLNAKKLDKAVKKGWITAQERDEIVNESH